MTAHPSQISFTCRGCAESTFGRCELHGTVSYPAPGVRPPDVHTIVHPTGEITRGRHPQCPKCLAVMSTLRWVPRVDVAQPRTTGRGECDGFGCDTLPGCGEHLHRSCPACGYRAGWERCADDPGTGGDE